ncbi:uncharacterized protein ACB057_013528 [Neosynchiropus ocellatus]
METRVDLQRESFSCSICLDLLRDPVTLHCGHSFCQVCVEGYWNRGYETKICECPQCRQTFTPRPLLLKNIMLAELVEELKKTGLQAADVCYAGPEDVACDSCTGRKLKALKSCLVCLTSYCEQHLQPHLEAPAFRRHKLVHPSKQLQEIICSQHDKVKEIFCRTDQQVICHLCAVDQHKDHHIVSATAERREREKEVDQSRGRIQQSIQEREEEVKLLQQEQKTISDSADKALKDSQETLQQLIQNLQRSMSDVEQQIRSRQETEAARVRGLQEQLEQEIAELKKRDAELQQLSLTDSHLVFLQNWSSLSEVSEDLLSSRTHVRPHGCFEEVAAAVSASRDRLQDLLRDTWTNISLMLAPEPKTRAEFLRYSRDITLDPNTAHSWLLLSEGNRKVRDMNEDQSPPHHPDRFTDYSEVLSKEPLTGRCYWEVERRGAVVVAVSYKNISRSGEESRFGYNDKSWCLYCYDSGCSFIHNSIRTKLSIVPSSRVGVYLDHSAGLLSFYSVSEAMTLLHRVQTRFTQPLHAGVWVWSSCEFLKLNGTAVEMEKSNINLQRESFSCSICLDLLKDPVTLNCGHSFCQVCVEGYWDSEDERNICQCPQCRRTFTPRPLLLKNIMLAELVEELKKTGLQAADLCYAGPEDVACDSCTGRKLKALKSCLVCLTSYCEQHLQPHLEAPAFRRHKLVHPSKQLQEIICSQHDEEKKMFCRTDQQVICALCAVDQHKDHHIVSAAAERREREKEVDQSRGRIQQSIQEREEEVKLLQQEQKTISDSADKAVKDSQETLQQLIQNLQRRMSDVEQQIRSRQETEAARVRGLQEQLEQEIAELKKKDAELQQLSLTDSHLVFLQNWSSLSEVSEDLLSSRTHVRPHGCFEEVAAAVSASRDRLQDLLRDTWTNISLMLAPEPKTRALAPEPKTRALAPEPKTRAEFLRSSRDITLDPNTAGSWLLLSEGNRKVTYKRKVQSPPRHPDRFTDYLQILSEEPLTGRCYWEVERRGAVVVAASYKNISRSGGESGFGYNDKSWCLWCRTSGCSFIHNSIRTDLSIVPSSRVGVYLDHSAGLLSFYSVSDAMTLLHRVQTTFTQPLHAGVWVWPKTSCEILKLN